MRILIFSALLTALVPCLYAQTRLIGEGTQSTSYSDTKIKIEVVIMTASLGRELSSLEIQRMGTIRIWTEKSEVLSCPLFITRPGDTKEHSLVAFFINRGYPSTLRIETWEKERKFEIKDTYFPDTKTSGIITEVIF